MWYYIGGVASLTLKDIPAGLHEELRQRASRNRRSLSQEALACLELATAGERIEPDQWLVRARQLRTGVKRVSSADVRTWVTQGRP